MTLKTLAADLFKAVNVIINHAVQRFPTDTDDPDDSEFLAVSECYPSDLNTSPQQSSFA